MAVKLKKEILDYTILKLEKYKSLLLNKQADIPEELLKDFNSTFSDLMHLRKICLSSVSSKHLTKESLKKKESDIRNKIVYLLSKIQLYNDLSASANKRTYYKVKVLESKYKPNMVEFKGKSFNELRRNILAVYKPHNISTIYCNMRMLKSTNKFKDKDKEFNDVESFFTKDMVDLNLFLKEDSNFDVIKKMIVKQKEAQLKFLLKEKRLRESKVKKVNEKINKLHNSSKDISKDKILELKEYLSNKYWVERNLSKNIGEIIDKYSCGQIENIMEYQAISQFKNILDSITRDVGKIYSIHNIQLSPKEDLNFIADCERGTLRVKTISAGGHNVQMFHYRTLTHILKSSK